MTPTGPSPAISAVPAETPQQRTQMEGPPQPRERHGPVPPWVGIGSAPAAPPWLHPIHLKSECKKHFRLIRKSISRKYDHWNTATGASSPLSRGERISPTACKLSRAPVKKNGCGETDMDPPWSGQADHGTATGDGALVVSTENDLPT